MQDLVAQPRGWEGAGQNERGERHRGKSKKGFWGATPGRYEGVESKQHREESKQHRAVPCREESKQHRAAAVRSSSGLCFASEFRVTATSGGAVVITSVLEPIESAPDDAPDTAPCPTETPGKRLLAVCQAFQKKTHARHWLSLGPVAFATTPQAPLRVQWLIPLPPPPLACTATVLHVAFAAK